MANDPVPSGDIMGTNIGANGMASGESGSGSSGGGKTLNLSKSLFTGEKGTGDSATPGNLPNMAGTDASMTAVNMQKTANEGAGAANNGVGSNSIPATTAVIGGAKTSAPTNAPSSGPGFKQAFVPAVGVPELQSIQKNTAGTTFNAGGPEAAAGIDFDALNKKEVATNLPKAGIVQGILPGAKMEDEPGKKEKKAVLPFKLSPKQWIYVGLGAVFIIVLGILGFSLLNGTEEPEIATGPVTQPKILLEYWGLWEPDDVMAGVFREYEQKNNVTINYRQMNIQGYRQELQDAIRAGNGPDLFRYHLTWQPMLKDDLAVATDETAPYTREDYQKIFYPVTGRVLDGPAGITGVPTMYDGLVLLYNKDIFTLAGGVSEPKNWGEFKNLARRLTLRDESGAIVRGGAAIGLMDGVDHGSDLLGLLALQYGVNLSFPDPTDPVNNAKMEQALQDYTSYYNDEFDVPGTRVWDNTLGGSLDAFAAGKVAMIFVPTYRLLDLQNMNPDLNVGVATLPTLNTRTDPTWASFWTEGVNALSPATKQAAAWKLLQYMSSKEVLQILYQDQLTLGRPIGEIYPRTDMANLLASSPYAQPLLSDAPRSSTYYICDNTWDEGINDELIKYYTDAVTGMTIGVRGRSDRMSASEGLNLIQRGTKEVLTKYGM